MDKFVYCLHIALFLFLKKQNCLWVQQRLAPDAGRLEVHEHVPPLLQHPAAELEVDVISWKIGFYFGLNVNPTSNIHYHRLMDLILTKLYSFDISFGADSSIVAENSITFVI